MKQALFSAVGGGSLWIAASLLAATALSASSNELRSLDLQSRPEDLLMTENGKHLIANDARKTLRVIDPVALKEVTAIEVPATGPILSRGGKLYVSERDTGLVKVFSEDNWELLNEVDTGLKPLQTLSARAGEKFGGVLLASSGSAVHVVDVEKDEHHPTGSGNSAAQFSASGDQVIHMSDRKYSAFDAANYLKGKPGEPLAVSETSGVRDPRPYVDDFWIGWRGIYVGLAPSSHMEQLGPSVVPDPSPETRLLYVVNGRNIEVRRLDEGFSLIETVVLDDDIPDHSGSQPCVRRNDDGSVSMFWISNRANGVASVTFRINLPVRADEVGTQRIQLPVADKNELVTAPDGSTVSGAILSWEPNGKPEPGRYSFKVKQTVDGKVSFFRESIEVLPAEPSLSVGVTRLAWGPETELPIVTNPSSDGIAVLDDRRLLVFDADGAIKRILPLDKPYHDVAMITGGFALGRKGGIDFADLAGKMLGSIDLDEVELARLATGADGKTLYASCKDPTEQELAKSFPVYSIDIETRKARRMDRVAGSGLIANRAGDQLISFISHSQLHSVGLLRYVEENTDVLMSYRVMGDRMPMQDSSESIVTGIRGLSYSPDGKFVAVSSHGVLSRGGMTYGQKVPVFSAKNLKKPERIISVEQGGAIQASYHPKLDQVYVLANNRGDSGKTVPHITAYGSNGNVLAEKFSGDSKLPSDTTQLIFSPDGSSLLVTGRDVYGRRIIKRLPLRLSPEEKAICAEPPPAPTAAFAMSTPGVGSESSRPGAPEKAAGGSDGLSPSQIAGLTIDSASQEEMSPEAMGAFRMPSVVIVNSGNNGIGAGFFVSGDGHIVTAAHCLPTLGGPMVSHYMEMPFGRLEFETPSTVVDVDESLDLALIKIDFNAETGGLKLASRESAVGSKVYAIGHPGLEDLSLNHTLTEGIVSSEVRMIEGRSLVQISAAVNPGNSGGPVLDSRGCVIGMVSQKAHLEGASFAVPAGKISQFIGKSKSPAEPPATDREALMKKIHAKGWLSIDELTYRGDSYKGKKRAHLKGDPKIWFSGTVVMQGNPPDHTFFTSEYKDGYPDGETIVFDRQEKRVSLTNYAAGEKEGLAATYHDSGNPHVVHSMHKGKPNGFFREYYDKPLAVKEAVRLTDSVRAGPSYMMDELGRVTMSAFFQEGDMVTQTTYNHYDRKEGIPIIEYTKAGDIEMIQELVRLGASINAMAGKKAPIHVAAGIKYHYMVKGVIELGADVDAKDGDDKTALQLVMAEAKPSIPIAQLLVESGADKALLSDAQRALLNE